MFNVEIKNLDKIQMALRKAPEISTEIFRQSLQTASLLLLDNARARELVPFRTGNLLQSFRKFSNDTTAVLKPTAYYATYVDQGTKYMQPRRYMEQILQKATPSINKEFNRAVDLVAQKLANS